MFKLALGLVIGALLIGCSAGIGQSGIAAAQHGSDPLRLIVQVCLQTDLARKNIGFQSVRHDSVGFHPLSAIGTTQAGQPVFETYSDPVSELQAVLVTLQRPSHFYFQPPSDATPVSWSTWRIPNAVVKDGNWSASVGMINGVRAQPMPVVEPNPPMIRYRLMSFDAYLEQARQRRANAGNVKDLPSC